MGISDSHSWRHGLPDASSSQPRVGGREAAGSGDRNAACDMAEESCQNAAPLHSLAASIAAAPFAAACQKQRRQQMPSTAKMFGLPHCRELARASSGPRRSAAAVPLGGSRAARMFRLGLAAKPALLWQWCQQGWCSAWAAGAGTAALEDSGVQAPAAVAGGQQRQWPGQDTVTRRQRMRRPPPDAQLVLTGTRLLPPQGTGRTRCWSARSGAASR